MKFHLLAAVLALASCGCDQAYQSVPGNATQVGNSTFVSPDNSAINERDRASTAKTPVDQNENQNDVRITADIRKRVVDTTMSTNAQNVKIITQNGMVTLRGPVKSVDEKNRIEEIARSVAGVSQVDSHLEVAR